ncbi:alpha/beta hydrolase [Terricaulis sp.]|uniref:alpha/beta hydrolase n=1 Tax=Terricaulis sp. TaxID=2768686 RepID=UPI000B095CAA|nr:dienelactone hydrolase family protein [Terricaulis sp.]MDZ4690703.1 dienelactone hydrolase family protein [Terricaulis sp.]
MTVFLDGPRMPPARGGKPDALVILLHGYGSNGADLISLAPYLAPLLPGAVFVAPNGIEDVPQAPGGFQWFPISNLDPHLMESGARAAAQSIDRFIDRELEKYGLDPSRLALVGFSQGTMMALHIGLRREKQIAGILGFSGVLVGARNLKEQMRSKPPVLLIHGDRDPTIPIPAMFDSAEALAEAGHGAQWHISYGVPHSIGPDGLDLGGAFLANCLKTQKILAAS